MIKMVAGAIAIINAHIVLHYARLVTKLVVSFEDKEGF